MTKHIKHPIKLLSKTYEIKCPEDQVDNLELAAEKLNHALRETKKKHKHLDDYQTLLLSSIHLTHELIIEQKKQEHQRQQVAHFMNSLESKINQVIALDPDKDPQTD